MKRQVLRSLGFAALFGSALVATAAEDVPPPPPPVYTPSDTRPPSNVPCPDCGVIRSIRAVERERAPDRTIQPYMSSPEYLNERQYSPPYVGPVIGITFGAGQPTKGFVGAAGSQAMRQRLLEIVYEVIVRYDDGRFGLVEVNDATGLRIGDRVKRVDGKLELLPREQK